MAAKKKAAKAGKGAVSAGKAVQSNEYVQRLVEDEELRENLRTAFDSAKRAYSRINGKGPVKALTEDKKTQKELRDAASSLREAADALRGKKRRRRGGLGKLLLVAIVGGGLALALSEDLRKKVLDALFGAEEEFEYSSSTSPGASQSTGQPVGTT
jgi:DNA-binding transcriptional regulator PaaX